jgi:3'(2'), 5'-bisphosphate nucleotidase
LIHDSFDHASLTNRLLPSVLEAGRIEMSYFRAGIDIERKEDKSPVTAADREAEALITAALHAIAPDVPVIGEEAASDGRLPSVERRFFLVDALDGTRLFVKQKPEFTINIALVDDGRPIYGLIYAPALSALYATFGGGDARYVDIAPDSDANLQTLAWAPCKVRRAPHAGLMALNSSTAGPSTLELLDRLGVRETMALGSSLKFCRVAAGEADLYVRLGNTHEWDTAAGQAILAASGGCVVGLDGRPLSYGNQDRKFLNPAFIAAGDPGPLAERMAAKSG